MLLPFKEKVTSQKPETTSKSNCQGWPNLNSYTQGLGLSMLYVRCIYIETKVVYLDGLLTMEQSTQKVKSTVKHTVQVLERFG